MEDLMSNNKKRILPFFAFLLWITCTGAVSQQLPQERLPVNVAGNWTIYAKGDDGNTSTKYIQVEQNGSTITGHFKGPNQSGGLEGTVDFRHIVFRTKTREVLTFRGMINGDTMQGNFGIRGIHGVWQATRTQ
jgi:hypothetical protein